MAVIVSLPVVHFVPNPVLTSVTPTGGLGTSYSYKLVAVAADGTLTAASAAVTDASGPTTLDVSHYETLAWTDPVGAASIKIYRTAGGATQGLIGTVAAGVQTFVDNGIAGDGSTPSASNGTGVGGMVDTNRFREMSVHFAGTFVGTIQLQASNDGLDFQNVDQAFTAPGFTQAGYLADAMAFLRVVMTAYTSGTPRATLCAHEYA